MVCDRGAYQMRVLEIFLLLGRSVYRANEDELGLDISPVLCLLRRCPIWTEVHGEKECLEPPNSPNNLERTSCCFLVARYGIRRVDKDSRP